MAQPNYDIAIVGGGPGGYVAAIRAAQLGMTTALIEREHLGGICLNWGCIPTKALLRSAEVYHLLQNARDYGLSADAVGFDLARMVKRSRQVAARLSLGVASLLKKNKVTVIEATARLAEPNRLALTDKAGETLPSISAKHIVLATGARPRSLPDIAPDGRRIWTYKEALQPDVLPRSLLVIGSGAIGIEFASFYRALGVEVTVVEVMDRILPAEDAEISALAEKAFRRRGLRLMPGTRVVSLRQNDEEDAVTVTLARDDETTEEATFHRVILAVGVTGNGEGLGLEEAGVVTAKGHVVVDEWLRTSVDGVYAIGDLAGPPCLAHKASHEGILCVERIAGLDHLAPLDPTHIPACTYSFPQIASLGLTEAAAREAGHDITVGRFPYRGNGKAIALGEPDGLIKTIFDAKSGELLGAHMIGAEVTELVAGFSIARTGELTEADLAHTVFAHPTLSEMLHESVLDALGRVIHT